MRGELVLLASALILLAAAVHLVRLHNRVTSYDPWAQARLRVGPARECTGGRIRPTRAAAAQISEWEREYASRSFLFLVAEERRLREEHENELIAEIDWRFRFGFYAECPGKDLPHRTTGRLVAYGTKRSMRYVRIERETEPRFFEKEAEADWLAAEIRFREEQRRWFYDQR